LSGFQAACQCGSAGSRRSCKAQLPISISPSSKISRRSTSAAGRITSSRLARSCSRSNADTRLQRDPSGNLHSTDTGRDRASDETAPSARSSAQRSSTTMSLPSCPRAGYELIEGHRCASTAGFVEPFNFAAVGARQPTSRARVLEVRIQSPPAKSLQTMSSAAAEAAVVTSV
jgi:hypothetical protein